MRRVRRLRWVAVMLVATGVAFLLAGGDQAAARIMLLGGLVYAVVSVMLERRERRERR